MEPQSKENFRYAWGKGYNPPPRRRDLHSSSCFIGQKSFTALRGGKEKKRKSDGSNEK
jgi:hypothetical protein